MTGILGGQAQQDFGYSGGIQFAISKREDGQIRIGITIYRYL
jgi:hypothetical protein